MNKLEKAKNVGLDALAISALSGGIALIPSEKLLEGVILVSVGVILCGVKYLIRK